VFINTYFKLWGDNDYISSTILNNNTTENIRLSDSPSHNLRSIYRYIFMNIIYPYLNNDLKIQRFKPSLFLKCLSQKYLYKFKNSPEYFSKYLLLKIVINFWYTIYGIFYCCKSKFIWILNCNYNFFNIL